MAKIIINSSVISSNEKEMLNNKKAILKDGVINYNIDDILTSIYIKDNSVMLVRESNDKKITLEFNKDKKTHGIYQIKPLNIKIEVMVETKEIIISENGFSVNYDLYMNGEFSDSFKYNLEWR